MTPTQRLLASLLLGSAIAASAATQPNIVFVLTDDQGYGDISAHGNPILKTPNLDRLHKEGVRFKQFQVSPTCAPTRSALFTGRHEFKNGITHTIHERERMTLDAVTLSEVLKSAGYTTGIFGKWHLGDEDAYQPEKRGFDEVFIHGAGGIGQTYAGSCGDAPGNSYFNPAIKHNGTFVKTTGYCTDVFFGQAMKWIEAKKGAPFFAYIPLNAPHGPLHVPPEYEKMYADKVKPNEAKFFGMIANIDDNVGRLLAKLDELKLTENTLVIFMNDNGGTAGKEIFNAGLHGGKGSAWQGGTRASSFWRWPGTFQPHDVNELTAHVDFFPTLAEITGATLPEKAKKQIEGLSLLSLLKGSKVQWRTNRTLVTHVGRWQPGTPPEKFWPGQVSIRNTRFSLVRSKQGWELFDLSTDPGESKDVSADHPDAVKSLSAAYDKWWDEVTPMLVNEDAYKTAPKVNPFKEQYWKQFGGGPEAGAEPAKPKKRNVR